MSPFNTSQASADMHHGGHCLYCSKRLHLTRAAEDEFFEETVDFYTFLQIFVVNFN